MPVITIQHLSKEYTTFRSDHRAGFLTRLWSRERQVTRAIDDLSLTVNEGQVLGLLGSNGAGKTTLIKCLTGVLTPDRGDVEVLGFKPYQERKSYTRHIGLVMGQKSLLLWDVPVVESLKLYRDIYEVSQPQFEQRLAEFTELLDLGAILDTPVRKLSLGQRMRAEFVAALLHHPSVIFLDEPTIGLDVLVKDRIRRFLTAINKKYGTTIVITTHDMRDVEALCSRVLLLERGHLTYDGTVDRLRQLQTDRVVHLSFSHIRRRDVLQQLTGKYKVLRQNELALSLEVPQAAILDVVQTAMSALDLTDLAVEAPSLEHIMRVVMEKGYKHAAL